MKETIEELKRVVMYAEGSYLDKENEGMDYYGN